MSSLANLAAQPGPLLSDDARQRLLTCLPGWQCRTLEGTPRLERCYSLGDFDQALALANRIGALAAEVDHHPALLVEWGKLSVSWWSHSLGGLQQMDFILAARCDQLAEQPLT